MEKKLTKIPFQFGIFAKTNTIIEQYKFDNVTIFTRFVVAIVVVEFYQ